MNKIIKKYKQEIRVLLLALLFAAIGDLFYGGASGADSFLVGVILSSTSTLLFTVFTIMVLFKLVISFFVSDRAHKIIRDMLYPEQGTKPKLKEKK